jgi:retinol dehydrogenase-12
VAACLAGSTSGIGTETARVLALRGAHVYVGGRTIQSAASTKDSILKDLTNAKVDTLAPLDLNSQASIRKSAASFLALNKPLNLLINNAGVMQSPYGLTEDGIEYQLGINHIGHFLLTNLLLGKLKETANATGIESRIVNVSSMAIVMATKEGVKWDNINDKKGYNSTTAYGLSKIANVYHAQELTKRLQEDGVTNVTINSLHPGVINTNLLRHNRFLWDLCYMVTSCFWKSVPQGAATTCYAALHPSLKGVSGKYYNDCNEFKASKFNRLADDEEAARKLWDVSVNLTTSK